LTYNQSWPYFKNAISQSGYLFGSKFLSKSSALLRTSAIATNAGCLFKDDPTMFNCLQQATPLTIMQASQTTSLPLNSGSDAIVSQPIDSFPKGNFKNCSLLIGWNSKDYIYKYWGYSLANLLEYETSVNNNFSIFYSLVNETFSSYSSNLTVLKSFVDNAAQIYAPKNNNISYFLTYIDVATDTAFRFPSLKLAEYLSTKNPNVFAYTYGHHISTTKYPTRYEALHGQELSLNFAETLSSSSAAPVEEKMFSETIVNYWANFIKSNDPNVGVNTQQQWPKYNLRDGTSKRKVMFLNVSQTNAAEFSTTDPKYLSWLQYRGLN